MNNKEKQAQRLSIMIIVSVFTVIISTTILIATINSKSGNMNKDLIDVGYGNIDSINPLLFEETKQNTDKTSANIEIISEIKRVYNIDVIYGDSSYPVIKTVNGTSINDQEKIYDFLIELMDCLDKYPKNLIKEIQLYGYNVEIFLTGGLSENNIALATRDSNNNFRMFLSNTTDNKVKKSIHHEMYHILEYYMKLQYNIDDIYKNWTNFNPTGFEYKQDVQKLDAEYVYNVEDNNSGDYFVTVYAKYSDQEDRAETFADMMIYDKAPSYYTDNLGAIKGKANLITKALDESFDSVKYTVTLYWKRFL